jgi:hypothetical protein
LLLGQHAASAAAVEAGLRAAGRWHSLALLQLHAGESQAALDTWKVRICLADSRLYKLWEAPALLCATGLLPCQELPRAAGLTA